MTQHFSLKELCFSQTALTNNIQNLPLGRELSDLHWTAAGLERVRAFLGYPIKINSAFRSVKLNELVGGSKNSQHCKGQAADITCPAFGDPYKTAKALRDAMKILGIDQLILEKTWVHVSFSQNPRYQVMTKLANGTYANGLEPDLV